jgi:ABC-type multidrug transport system permease subunit
MVSDGVKLNEVPQTASELERTWLNSRNCKDALHELQEYENEIEAEQPSRSFIAEVQAAKGKFADEKKSYSVSYLSQILACCSRQLKLRKGDKFSFMARNVSALVQGLIYASVFFKMPQTEDGLLTRGGALFAAILFNAMSATLELPFVFMGRLTLQKHRAFALYRPSAFHIAQVITDIPFLILQALIFSVVTYFMYGLGKL